MTRIIRNFILLQKYKFNRDERFFQTNQTFKNLLNLAKIEVLIDMLF